MPVVACHPEIGGLRPCGKNAVYIIIPDFSLKSKSFSRFFQKIRRERPPGKRIVEPVQRRMGLVVHANADAHAVRRTATDRPLRMSTDEYGWLRSKRGWNRQTTVCGHSLTTSVRGFQPRPVLIVLIVLPVLPRRCSCRSPRIRVSAISSFIFHLSSFIIHHFSGASSSIRNPVTVALVSLAENIRGRICPVPAGGVST